MVEGLDDSWDFIHVIQRYLRTAMAVDCVSLS